MVLYWAINFICVFSAAILAVLMIRDHHCFDLQQKAQEKQILSVSFLKHLLQLWKVNELLFENATPVSSHHTDSLLLSCSKEENMLTAPFKSCWRLCRSFGCPTSGPALLLECQSCQKLLAGYPVNMCYCGFQACQTGASGSLCAGVSCENQQKDHSALVTRIVPRHDKKILPQKANAAYGCIWNVLLDRHAAPQVAD